MSTVKLTTKKIKGQDVDIFATTDGTFQATVNGELAEKATLQQLVDRVGVLLSVKLVPVEVTILERPHWPSRTTATKFRDALLTGVHSSNGNMLINNGTRTGQMSANSDVYVKLTEEDKAEYFRLQTAKENSYEAFNKWEKKYTLTTEKARKLLGIPQPKTAGV
jgi:hypothetical protein